MKSIFRFPESHAPPPPLRFLKQEFSCFKHLFPVLGSRTRPFRHLSQLFVHQKNTTGMSWSKEHGANKKKEGTPENSQVCFHSKDIIFENKIHRIWFCACCDATEEWQRGTFSAKAASRKQDKRHFLTKGQYFIQKTNTTWGNESEHKKNEKNSMGNVGGSNPRSLIQDLKRSCKKTQGLQSCPFPPSSRMIETWLLWENQTNREGGYLVVG